MEVVMRKWTIGRGAGGCARLRARPRWRPRRRPSRPELRHEHRRDGGDASRHGQPQRRWRPRTSSPGEPPTLWAFSRRRRPASAGSGDAAVARVNQADGLSPDTTYYYALVATNSQRNREHAGRDAENDRQPGADDHNRARDGSGGTCATMVDTISPNNQATNYHFEYGLTASYGFQTYTKTCRPVAHRYPSTSDGRYRARERCSITAWSLEPRLDVHDLRRRPDVRDIPWPRRTRVSSRPAVSPGRAAKGPFVFTVQGKISRPR